MRRIGILGGTFNPVHNGHINLARQLTRILKLDRVIFVPAYIPPHKKLAVKVGSKERLKMVKLAIKKYKHFSVSSFEIEKKGKSYSIDTLKFFKEKFKPDTKLFFLTGRDSLPGLGKWKNLKGILGLAEFVVATRPGFGARKKPPEVKSVRIKPLDISSSKIRSLIKKGEPCGYMIPTAVLRYIKRKGLYKT